MEFFIKADTAISVTRASSVWVCACISAHTNLVKYERDYLIHLLQLISHITSIYFRIPQQVAWRKCIIVVCVLNWQWTSCSSKWYFSSCVSSEINMSSVVCEWHSNAKILLDILISHLGTGWSWLVTNAAYCELQVALEMLHWMFLFKCWDLATSIECCKLTFKVIFLKQIGIKSKQHTSLVIYPSLWAK